MDADSGTQADPICEERRMSAKTYLERYKIALQRVRQYEERVDMITTFLKGIDMDGQPHGTNIGKPTENIAINLALLKEQLVYAKAEAEQIRQEIADQIDQMENVKYKELLYCRYVLLLPWTKVAQRLDVLRPGKEYELKSVIGYMHRKALKEFERRFQ